MRMGATMVMQSCATCGGAGSIVKVRGEVGGEGVGMIGREVREERMGGVRQGHVRGEVLRLPFNCWRNALDVDPQLMCGRLALLWSQL